MTSLLSRGRTVVRRVPRPARPPLLRPLTHVEGWSVAGALGAVLVIAAGQVITAGVGGVDALDLGVVEAASAAHSPGLDWAALLVDWLFSPRVGLLLLALATLVVGATTRRVLVAATFAGIVVSSWLGAGVVKVIVHRDRPDPAALQHPLIIEPHSFSYPSGHTALAAGFAVAVVFLARDSRRRRLVVALVVAATLVVGASRVWVGVHHPTDVVASMVLAGSVVALVLPPWLRLLNRLERTRS